MNSSIALIARPSLSLIHESLYAPQCPEEAARLFDAALTLQNDGQYAFAINALMDAQKAWEGQLLKEHYPDIEDVVANSILLQLRMADSAEEEAKRTAMVQEIQMLGSTNEEIASRTDVEKLSISDNVERYKDTIQEKNAVTAKAEAERRITVELENERRQFAEEREAKRQEKIQAIHHCYQLIPVVGNIFIQLRLSSIYQSAGNDERALVTALHALKFCQTIPKYTHSLITAAVYHTIGIIYCHLSQLDYASDYFFKTLEIREMTLGTGHVETATVLHNIGCVLHMLGQSSDSLVMLYNSLRILEHTLPQYHPRIETCEGNINRVKASLPPSVHPKVPFTPNELIPVIPGAKRAKQFYAVPSKIKDKVNKR